MTDEERAALLKKRAEAWEAYRRECSCFSTHEDDGLARAYYREWKELNDMINPVPQ